MSLITTMCESFCTIRRPTIGRDNAQGTTQSFNPGIVVGCCLPCSQQENNASADTLYGQRNTFNSTTFFFAKDPKCEVNDRIESVDRTGTLVYYLCSGRAQPVGRGRFWQVDATRIRATNN